MGDKEAVQENVLPFHFRGEEKGVSGKIGAYADSRVGMARGIQGAEGDCAEKGVKVKAELSPDGFDLREV